MGKSESLNKNARFERDKFELEKAKSYKKKRRELEENDEEEQFEEQIKSYIYRNYGKLKDNDSN